MCPYSGLGKNSKFCESRLSGKELILRTYLKEMVVLGLLRPDQTP